MSPEEKAAQAKSFAYGNVHMHNPDVTRAVVDRAYEKLYPAAPAEGATMKDSHGLGDQLRTRVPTWTCPACKMKFHTRAEYDAHKAEELTEKV